MGYAESDYERWLNEALHELAESTRDSAYLAAAHEALLSDDVSRSKEEALTFVRWATSRGHAVLYRGLAMARVDGADLVGPRLYLLRT